MGTKSTRALLATTALAFFSASPLVAHAADKADTAKPDATAPASDQGGPGDIVVTAQKRSEPLQKVPVSISVASGDLLASRGITEPLQLAAAVPALAMQSQPNQVSGIAYSIRGIGTAVYGNSVESSVSTVIDGISYGRPEMAAVQFFDIAQIEVLEGPQGMLFGKNASAGAVSVTTNSPVLGKLEGNIHASYGNMATPGAGHEMMLQGVLNMPVTQNSALRVAAFGSYRSPLVANLNTNLVDKGDQGMTEYGVRAKYKWEIDDHWTLDLGADITREVGAGNSNYTTTKLAKGGKLAALTAKYASALSNPSSYFPYNEDSYAKTYQFVASGVQGNLGYQFDSGLRIDNLMGYRSYTNSTYGDLDHLPINIQDVSGGTIQDHQFSDELKFTSPDSGPLKYVGGLYYFTAAYNRVLSTTGQGEGLGLPAAPTGMTYYSSLGLTRATFNSYAAYGQATLHVAGPLTAIGGMRFTHDDNGSTGTQSAPNGVVSTVGVIGSWNYKVSQSNLSYRLGAQLQLAPNVMAYTSYSRGYKGPALAYSPSIAYPVIRPEIPMAWELGIKSSWLDHKVIFNASIWHEKIRDFQAQATDIATNFTGLINAGSIISKGVETNLTVKPLRGLTLNTNVVYTDAYYGSFQGQSCYAGEPSGTSGTNVCLPNKTTDATGDQLANSSKWTYAVNVDYEHDIGANYKGHFGATWNYRSSVNFSSTNNPQTTQAGYGLLGGNLGIESISGGWKASIYFRNLLNKHFSSYIVEAPTDGRTGDNALGGNYVSFWSPDATRTVGVTLDKKF